MHDFWQKQGCEPLFPNLVWARPENKSTAGKLLIIGGTGQGFAGAAESYGAASQAGIGSQRIILPDSLMRTVSKLFPSAEYAPSTPSGSFALSALAGFLEAAEWSDGVMIASDTGNNSETTQLFETLLTKYDGQITICGNTIDALSHEPYQLLGREETCLVLSFDQLQKFASASRFTTAFTSTMGILRFVETLNEFGGLHKANLIITYENRIVVYAKGHISSTERTDMPGPDSVAAHAATWWLQNPAKPYEAITTSLLR